MRCMLMLLAAVGLAGCSGANRYDVIIRGGQIYDGTGADPVVGDVGIRGDRIAAVGDLSDAWAGVTVDAEGLAVAPGFINVLSWANETLIADGRGMSDVLQGVTMEVLGEGWSMGPLNEAMKADLKERQGDVKYDVAWTTLGEYLEFLVNRGVTPNVASFVGATSVRIHELGHDDRPPTADELERMKSLVRQAMEEGALGVSTSLIYAPAFYADTEELVALASVAADHGGMYISHLRNEGDSLLEAFEELLEIARRAKIRAEVYHLKASGQANWPKLDELIARIDRARAEGLHITADMYTYRASSTGLNAIMPPWVQEGGHDAWVERLKDPAIRERVKREMNLSTRDWDNGYVTAGSPENILLVEFQTEALRPLTGKTLAEVATMRGCAPEDAAMDLVIEDDSRVGAVFFTMSEDNIRKKVQLPWMSFCSDAGAYAAEGHFLKHNPHPRSYGSFARLFGRYVREEKLIALQEAIRRLTSLPADNLRLVDRGRLAEGHFADVVVFDPETIADHATFDKPHQYATGVEQVWINGTRVVKDGKHTGRKPGRVVRGPGWKVGNRQTW